MQVELGRHEARLDWELARADDDPQPRDLSAEDKAVLRREADEFETRLARDALIAEAVREPESAYEIRSMSVRDRILREAQVRADPRDIYAAMDRIADLDPKEKEVVGVYSRAARSEGFRTKIAGRGYQFMEEAARHSRPFLARVKAKLQDAGRPARSADLSREMGTHVLNLLVGDVHGELGSAVGQVVDDTIRRRQEAQLHRYLNDLDGDIPIDDALARVAAEEPGRPFLKASDLTEIKDQVHRVATNMPSAEAVATKLREHPPAVQAVDEPGVRTDVAFQAIDKYVRRLPPSEGRRNLEPLADFAATYPVHFPPQPYAETQTEHGKLVAHWDSDPDRPFVFDLSPRVDLLPQDGPGPFPFDSGGGGGGGGGGSRGRGAGGGGGGGGGGSGGGGGGGGTSRGSRPSTTPRTPSGSGGRMIPTPPRPSSAVVASRSVSRVGMARSFVRLRGFARIGGVLIGREPEGDATEKSPALPAVLLRARAHRSSIRPTDPAATPDWGIKDIRWELDGENIRLILTDRGGQVLRLPPLPSQPGRARLSLRRRWPTHDRHHGHLAASGRLATSCCIPRSWTPRSAIESSNLTALSIVSRRTPPGGPTWCAWSSPSASCTASPGRSASWSWTPRAS